MLNLVVRTFTGENNPCHATIWGIGVSHGSALTKIGWGGK